MCIQAGIYLVGLQTHRGYLSQCTDVVKTDWSEGVCKEENIDLTGEKMYKLLGCLNSDRIRT